MEDDLEHAAPLRVHHGLLEHEGADVADAVERIFAQRPPLGGDQRLHGQVHAVAHGREDIALVLEVPIDGAARDAGSLGNIGK
ncbi:hypothetical protein D3C81_1570130 [compost metagenome]